MNPVPAAGRFAVRLVALALILAAPAAESAQLQGNIVPVIGDFTGKAGKTAKDLSGIACVESGSTVSRHCLVVNDENRSVQFATLDSSLPKTAENPLGLQLTAGEDVPLYANAAPADVVGAPPPQEYCATADAVFGDLDGEAVAVSSARTFFVIGSHGCSRKKDVYNPSSFQLIRVMTGATDRDITLSTTYRVSERLSRDQTVAKYFTTALMGGKQGLNIEGLAWADGKLYIGLRAPNTGRACIFAIPEAELWAAQPLPTADGQPCNVQLGENIGIRDLTALPDGKLLVLGGPTEEQAIPYGLFLFDPVDATTTPLAQLTTINDDKGVPAKAEGLLLVGAQAKALDIVVLFDGLKNGGPRQYRISLP